MNPIQLAIAIRMLEKGVDPNRARPWTTWWEAINGISRQCFAGARMPDAPPDLNETIPTYTVRKNLRPPFFELTDSGWRLSPLGLDVMEAAGHDVSAARRQRDER